MKITQDMLNYWKKIIPAYQFTHYTLDNSLERTLYHSTIQFIGQSAFWLCNNLENVELPSATRIEKQAFYECRSLTSINLPAATTIGQYVFGQCTNLATVTLGSNLSSIATDTFLNCNSLTTINVMGDENCTTAQTLATLTPAQYHNATIVYNYTPPSENDSNDGE